MHTHIKSIAHKAKPIQMYMNLVEPLQILMISRLYISTDVDLQKSPKTYVTPENMQTTYDENRYLHRF